LCEAHLTVLKLLTGQKSGFSPHRLHQFTWDLAWPTGMWVHFAQLAVQNFTSIGAGGGNPAPKYQKFPLPLFGKGSSPLTDF